MALALVPLPYHPAGLLDIYPETRVRVEILPSAPEFLPIISAKVGSSKFVIRSNPKSWQTPIAISECLGGNHIDLESDKNRSHDEFRGEPDAVW